MTQINPVKVIAVSSGKGGVGKTNVAVNLATGLSSSGKKVMVMDADLGMANVDVMLGIRPKYDLYDVISGKRSLQEIIVEGPKGVGIVPASSGIGKMADLSVVEQGNLIRAFGELTDSVDILIVDTAAGISSSVISFCKAAHEIFVVVCDEPASVTDAYALIKVLNHEHGVKRFQVLANMVKDQQRGKQLFAKLSKAADLYLDLSLGYMGSIPLDIKLKQAVKEQTTVLQAYPASRASIAFQNLVQKVNQLPPIPLSTGFLEFFIERASMNENLLESVH